MESLASLYAKVGETLVFEARTLRNEQVEETLPRCIETLSRIEKDATDKAATVPAGSAKCLRDIAKSAKDSRTELAKRRRGAA